MEEKKKLEEEKSIALNKVRILEEKIQLTKEVGFNTQWFFFLRKTKINWITNLKFAIWKTNQLQYKLFIRTKTKPFIFYLPKEFESKSSSLLEETAILIDG